MVPINRRLANWLQIFEIYVGRNRTKVKASDMKVSMFSEKKERKNRKDLCLILEKCINGDANVIGNGFARQVTEGCDCVYSALTRISTFK